VAVRHRGCEQRVPWKLRAKSWVTQPCARFVAGHAATISLLSPAQVGSGARRHVVETLGSSHCWMTPTAPLPNPRIATVRHQYRRCRTRAAITSSGQWQRLQRSFPLGPGSGSAIDTCVLPVPVEAETYCRVSGDRGTNILPVPSSAWLRRFDRGSQPSSGGGGLRDPPARWHSCMGALLDDERGGRRACDLFGSTAAISVFARPPA
jgi:hypothetical protein